jgi:DNA helicase-2/ATP-dependent DNA helicase PcrA
VTIEEFDLKYTSKLNEQQKEAVHATDGAVLLLAVPGSGKTTVLVARLGFMVCCAGIAPGRILTMTYTRAATDEMRQRFGTMFGRQYAEAMEFSTINSLSLKIISFYSQYVAKRPGFTLVEERDAAKIIRQIYQEVAQEYPTDSTVKDVSGGVTYIKNMMLKDDEIENHDFGVPDMPQIFQKYRSELERQRLMDFDNQMVYAQAIRRCCNGLRKQ